jgi:hypothetical protein
VATGSPDTSKQASQEATKQNVGLWGWLLFLLLLVPFALVGYRIYPGDRTTQKNPGFIDIIFANNLVVFAARLTLFLVALVLAVTAFFIVRSMIYRMKAGEHLTQFGPLKVPEVEDLSTAVDFWQNQWAEVDIENTELRARIATTDAQLASLRQAFEDVTSRGHSEETGQEPISS